MCGPEPRKASGNARPEELSAVSGQPSAKGGHLISHLISDRMLDPTGPLNTPSQQTQKGRIFSPYTFVMAQIIRTAEIKDLSGIAKVHTQSWTETYSGHIPDEVLSQLTYERRLAQWERRLKDALQDVLVLELEGEIVAFAQTVHKPEETLSTESELACIYALKAHHGKGFGKQLMKASVRCLHDAGANTMGLWVLKDNPTIGFYERMGGQQKAENSMGWFGHDLPVLGYVWNDLSPILNA